MALMAVKDCPTSSSMDKWSRFEEERWWVAITESLFKFALNYYFGSINRLETHDYWLLSVIEWQFGT